MSFVFRRCPDCHVLYGKGSKVDVEQCEVCGYHKLETIDATNFEGITE